MLLVRRTRLGPAISPPVAGRYYVSIAGSGDIGPGGAAALYYGVDIMAHTVVGNLEITASSSDPNADPTAASLISIGASPGTGVDAA